MATAKEVYCSLLEICDAADIKVSHHEWNDKQPYDSLMEVTKEKQEIKIELELALTRKGCYILAHEMGHIHDAKKGRYKKFFYAPENSMTDTARNRKLIENAEWSANLFAQKLLKEAGLSFKKLRVAQKSYFLKMLPLYYEIYFEQYGRVHRRRSTNKSSKRSRKSSRRRNRS